MPFFDISPKFAKELAMGNFLTPPEDATVKASSDPDNPFKIWRETLTVIDIKPMDFDNANVINVRFAVPADVVSGNQGRTVNFAFRFPTQALEEGEPWAKTGFEINYKNLLSFVRACGFDGELAGPIDKLAPWEDLQNARVDAQIKLGPGKDGVVRQELQYFREPK